MADLLPRAEAVLARPVDAECPNLRLWPVAGVPAIFGTRLLPPRSRWVPL